MDTEPSETRTDEDRFHLFVHERFIGVQDQSFTELIKSLRIPTPILQSLLCNVNQFSKVSLIYFCFLYRIDLKIFCLAQISKCIFSDHPSCSVRRTAKNGTCRCSDHSRTGSFKHVVYRPHYKLQTDKRYAQDFSKFGMFNHDIIF